MTTRLSEGAAQAGVAVINAGSSSIKFSMFSLVDGALQLQTRCLLEGLNTSPKFVAKDGAGTELARQGWGDGVVLGHAGGLQHLLGFVRQRFPHLFLLGLGHRVVHGGQQFVAPMRLDSTVVAQLKTLVPLAPLHQSHNLAPIEMALASAPDLPQVACFDTAFHRSNPEVAQMFALPYALHEAGVRRYGFHGLSYEYIASVLPTLASRAAAGKTVVLHLGNGASACAIDAGRGVASTMGFTALDGLPMGTRCGSVDAGVLIYLMDQRGMNARAIENLLYKESGLLGVSGVSSDMRALLASAEPRARLAVDLFVYRIQREIGSLAAALGGLDALVFTAGIGENSAEVRRRVAAGLGWLGVALDDAANEAGGPAIGSAGSRCPVYVIPTDEELMIARHTLAVLGGAPKPAA
jgi:acetate kinase